jgi:uncharacterized repeat protein (TIGR03803 family)
MEKVMNTHSKIDAAATRNSPAMTTRRPALPAAPGRRQQLLLGAMALVAGIYAFGANAPAQADTIRHNFCTPTCPPDGWQPDASLMLGSNTKLYGTAELGGTYGKGTVFWVKQNGTGYSTRYSFGTIASDGAYPEAGLLQYGSLVYGTTYEGGANNFGTVFCMKSAATAEFAHYSFGASATDGTYPQAGLTRVGNWLYGTTVHGGANGAGTVFRINTKCGQEQVLYSFAGGTDGAWPSGTLYYDSGNSLLYGTTQLGGSGCNCGTVFSVTTAGAESVVYSFTGNPDGSSPRGGVVLDSGTGLLFGTTEYGGQSLGTVFSVSPACSNSCSDTVYAFKGPSFPDGLYPYSNLIDVSGILYGTTLYGGTGTGCGANGCGTVFKVSATGFPNETPVYSFVGAATDGYAPAAGVLAVGTSLYGTTTSGGSHTSCGNASGCGTVFSVP